MQLEEGDAQIAATKRLVDLAARADRTADAMAAVEQMVAANPEQRELAVLLTGLYEQLGQRSKLAALLFDSAGRTTDAAERFERCAARARSRSRWATRRWRRWPRRR